jgi:hypothetical protein
MKTVNPGEVAFRNQFRLGLQPVLHLVPGQRPLVHISEVCPSGHFVRGRRKINFVLVCFLNCSRPRCINRLLVLILGEIFVSHVVRIGCATARPLWRCSLQLISLAPSARHAGKIRLGLGSDIGVNLPHRPEPYRARNSARQLPWPNPQTLWILRN